MILEPSISGKLDGYMHTLEALTTDLPASMVKCYYAARIDGENIRRFAQSLTLGKDFIFWEHIEMWKEAHYAIRDSLNNDLYSVAGYQWAHTLVEATGGSRVNGGILPYIIPDILPVIVIPRPAIVAADLVAGLLYGITERD
jgi:hypothetical protein